MPCSVKSRTLIKDKHVLLVPSGALTSLPFQVLVTKAPASPLRPMTIGMPRGSRAITR